VLRKIIQCSLLAFCLITATLASADQSNQLRLNQTMTKIGDIMIEMFPVIVAKRELKSAEFDALKQHIETLQTLFQQSAPFIQQKSDTYNVSLQYALSYLTNTRKLLDKDLDEARKQLYSLAPICTSCHTQDNKLRTFFSGSKRDQFGDDYSFAEFNYLSRNYELAISYYDKYLRSGQRKTELDIIQPLQRIVTIYTQIYNKPAEGAKVLKNYSKLKHHTQETRSHLRGWITGLEALAQKSGATNLTDFSAIKKAVKRILGPLDQPFSQLNLTAEQEIERVWLRGQLYHYLNNTKKQNEIPTILYWLSICDRSTGYNFYFSLADLYLNECMQSHPNHPYATRCFAEYEAFLTYRYSGSSGTHLPDEVDKALHHLRKKLHIR